MNLCRECFHFVPEQFERCPFCSAEMVDEEIEEVVWTIIRTVTTDWEARLIAGRLRAHDIPAVVLSQVDTTRNFTVGGLAVVKVFVPDVFFADAQLLLSEPPEEPGEDVWRIDPEDDDTPDDDQ